MVKKSNPVRSPPGPAKSIAASRAPKHKGTVPIVAIGASAGGLEALEQFLKNVPEGCGSAFVVILHLDPANKGLMPELLQRFTSMRVQQAKDRMKVKAGCVYVIPPNKSMSILKGTLHLLAPKATQGLRLPIDFFFRSLAEDQQERSIGVILSGMGSDGTLGLAAIKEKAGLTLVQQPDTAKYDSMPRSAIGSGSVDIVAPPEDLPERIRAILELDRPRPGGPVLGGRVESSLDKIVILLRAHSRRDYSAYKKSTLHRRIERRMGIHQIDKIATYVRYLQENSQELEMLSKELLIGVTNFFRDPAVWDLLRTKTIPDLIAARPQGGALRAWVPGCSTGEEAYSLAMVFTESLDHLRPERDCTLTIFATDLDPDAIERARQGLYLPNIAADVGPERLRRHFLQEGETYRVAKNIREMVVFATQNVLSDPPFTKVDIVSCRNLLIYLESEAQKRLMPVFHYSLNPDGILLLGSAETVGSSTDLFTSQDAKARLYRRADSPTRVEPAPSVIHFPEATLPGPASPAARTTQAGASLQALADQILLRSYCPAAVLVNDKGEILYINGRTGNYLEPAAGKANWNLLAMAREGLREGLTSAFQTVVRKRGTMILRNQKAQVNGVELLADITILAIDDPAPLRGTILVAFSKVDTSHAPKKSKSKGSTDTARTQALENEIAQIRATLQITVEEMQSSQEELKSANEELQSTNEELQSTNEELTTSREEMQSLNEELQTVNAELQHKVDELSQTNNDMQNLLNSTEIATVFLDEELRVRRFTPQANRIIRLIPGDIGRPLVDLASDLSYPELLEDASEALRTLSSRELQAPTTDGRWFTVRIMPYRTTDKKIDGVVITFSDISEAKALEDRLRESLRVLQELAPERAIELGPHLVKARPGPRDPDRSK